VILMGFDVDVLYDIRDQLGRIALVLENAYPKPPVRLSTAVPVSHLRVDQQQSIPVPVPPPGSTITC